MNRVVHGVAKSQTRLSDLTAAAAAGEGLFEINTNEVVKEDEHTMYNVNVFSD